MMVLKYYGVNNYISLDSDSKLKKNLIYINLRIFGVNEKKSFNSSICYIFCQSPKKLNTQELKIKGNRAFPLSLSLSQSLAIKQSKRRSILNKASIYTEKKRKNGIKHTSQIDTGTTRVKSVAHGRHEGVYNVPFPSVTKTKDLENRIKRQLQMN